MQNSYSQNLTTQYSEEPNKENFFQHNLPKILVEVRRIELLTYALQTRRSPS